VKLALKMLHAAPTDARKPTKQQRVHVPQRAAPGMRVMPRNDPDMVCWTPSGKPGSIVMGRDPDPFIRSQISLAGSACSLRNCARQQLGNASVDVIGGGGGRTRPSFKMHEIIQA
jgi:hypothetical protein